MRGKESKIALFFMMDQEVMEAEQREENMTKLFENTSAYLQRFMVV